MIASVYWRLAKEAGWTYPEIDDVTLEDFDGIAAQWKEAVGVTEEEDDMPIPSGPREVSEEEFRRIADATKGFAEKHGGIRNPFL